MFRLVVFDLDGTLIDSRKDIADAANALLVACGAPPLAEDQIGRMVGDGAGRLIARAFAAAGLVEPPDALPRFLDLYDARLLDHTRPYDGIVEVLEALSTRARLGVLTNKPLHETRRLLRELELARFVADDAVLGGDGPLPRKPHASGMRALMARFGVGPEATVLVGDSLVDWNTARNAGTAVCLARYGFGFETFPTDLLTGEEHLADRPDDLLRHL